MGFESQGPSRRFLSVQWALSTISAPRCSTDTPVLGSGLVWKDRVKPPLHWTLEGQILGGPHTHMATALL